MAKVGVSILSADFKKANEWLSEIEKGKPDMVQWDIMDGKYVPNRGVDLENIPLLRKKTKLFFDCHLMVEKPREYFHVLKNSGADSATFHVETVKEPDRVIEKIRSLGLGAGIAANNMIPVEKIIPFLGKVDIALVMTVEAGFGGQAFLPSTLEKVHVLRKLIDEQRFDCEIQVDGGIDLETGRKCVEAGADILIAGSFIFRQESISEAIKKLKSL
ncbi:MAG: ribulose-phosphate 3-epimerase [Candidatus Diapherotrites archaeon]|nr:ribulose-phosphate 3-epimerase [Candidatus Diapherotrites archaeon]